MCSVMFKVKVLFAQDNRIKGNFDNFNNIYPEHADIANKHLTTKVSSAFPRATHAIGAILITSKL